MRKTILHGSFVALLGLGTAGLALAQTPPLPSDTFRSRMPQRMPAVTGLTGARRRNTPAITAMTPRICGANHAKGATKHASATNVADRARRLYTTAGGIMLPALLLLRKIKALEACRPYRNANARTSR
jgi:hypothetical protein